MCIPNWPLPNGAFQDQCKHRMINNYSNKHNKVKNPNWREADQLAIYKRSREVELGATENNISQWSERDLNPRPTYGFQIRRSNHSATLSLSLITSSSSNKIHFQPFKWFYLIVPPRLLRCHLRRVQQCYDSYLDETYSRETASCLPCHQSRNEKVRLVIHRTLAVPVPDSVAGGARENTRED